VVATFLPVVSGWARRNGVSASRLLMPLSYAAILGGVWFYQSWTPANNIQGTRDFDVARQTAATVSRTSPRSWRRPGLSMSRRQRTSLSPGDSDRHR